jgi:hypothetical protein
MVNIHPMKITMMHHINTCICALLSRLEQRQQHSNQHIIELFEDQERVILRDAKNTEECLQLAKDITAAEGQLEEAQALLAQNKLIDRFLVDYRCVLLPRL